MQLPDSLVEVGLSLVPGSGNGKVDLPGVSDERGSLTRSFVEGMSLVGMTFFDLGGFFTKKKGAK